MFALLLALQAATTKPMQEADQRYKSCFELATSNPVKGMLKATEWKLADGGMLADQCLAVSYANQNRWPDAARAFEDAAHAADAHKDSRADTFWAQAGNAWLAGGDPLKARAALDTALAPGRLSGTALGEVRLDRGRALAAAGRFAEARDDLDQATRLAPEDGLGWLLSATLARRGNDLPRAKTDIAQALKLAADDPAVQLEAGNIAALDHDEAGAKSAWAQAVKLAPESPQAKSAQAALAQFAGDK
jgi:tetratricopeptide (TPR) repeat protein